jgi:two-component system chemotaxis sensor kinase CheA
MVLTTAAPAESIELVLEWAASDCRYTLSAIANQPPVERPSARITVDKLDDILRMAGELVTQQAQVHRLAASFQGAGAEQLRAGLTQIDARIHELQDAVLRTRLSPVSTVFAPFNRLVRDLAGPLGKQIRVLNSGERTEMDKALLEKIADPLLHLVRNCVDHGIESPAVRVAAGKSAEGEIRLYAAHRGGSVTIEVCDDGKGLDTQRILAKAVRLGLVAPNANLSPEQITNLVFLAGFSTADVTTELSGRGVGMDVVRRKVLELGGTIDISSQPGRGTRFTMSLPLSTSVVDGVTVSCADELYIVPLTMMVECIPWQQANLLLAADGSRLLTYQGEHLPVLDLDALLFGLSSATADATGLLVVVEDGDNRIALRVDALQDRQPIVLKSIDNGYGHTDGIGATAILATASAVARILDVPALVRQSGALQQQRRRTA